MKIEGDGVGIVEESGVGKVRVFKGVLIYLLC